MCNFFRRHLAFVRTPENARHVTVETRIRGENCQTLKALTDTFADSSVSSYPRTGTPASLAAFITSSKRCKLSSTEQFMFFLLNSSDAAPNMATSEAPAFTWSQNQEEAFKEHRYSLSRAAGKGFDASYSQRPGNP